MMTTTVVGRKGESDKMNDEILTYCDVINDCTECPLYADNCDGRESEDEE